MKKQLIFSLVIASSLPSYPMNSFSEIFTAGAGYLSLLTKSSHTITKNPYAWGASATALLILSVYARYRYKQLQQPYTDHQDGYCDVCHQAKPDLLTCDDCNKKKFLGIINYGAYAHYCHDCLTENAFENNDVFKCRFCRNTILDAVHIYSARNRNE